MAGIYDFLFGGAGGQLMQGGSLLDSAKQGIQQSALMKALGMGGDTVPESKVGQVSGVNPALMGGDMSLPWRQDIQQSQSPQSSTQGYDWAGLAKKMGDYGAGMSKASGATYGAPKTFGEIMASGQESMNAGQDKALDTRYKEAQIEALGNKGIDLEKTAQQALIKSNMGQQLTPEEQASLQAYDTMNQSKLSYTQDKFGNFIPQPAARSILPPNMPQSNPSGSPAPDLQGLRAYHQYLLQKAGQ